MKQGIKKTKKIEMFFLVVGVLRDKKKAPKKMPENALTTGAHKQKKESDRKRGADKGALRNQSKKNTERLIPKERDGKR